MILCFFRVSRSPVNGKPPLLLTAFVKAIWTIKFFSSQQTTFPLTSVPVLRVFGRTWATPYVYRATLSAGCAPPKNATLIVSNAPCISESASVNNLQLAKIQNKVNKMIPFKMAHRRIPFFYSQRLRNNERYCAWKKLGTFALISTDIHGCSKQEMRKHSINLIFAKPQGCSQVKLIYNR